MPSEGGFVRDGVHLELDRLRLTLGQRVAREDSLQRLRVSDAAWEIAGPLRPPAQVALNRSSGKRPRA